MKALLLFLLLWSPVLRAEPPDPENYVVVSGGFVQLAQGTWIEGSAKVGGEQPDFLVDMTDARLKPLLDYARELRAEAKPKEEKIRLIADFIERKVLPQQRNAAYDRMLKAHRDSGKPVSLGEYAACAAGSCRESSLLLHIASLEAGIPNYRLYGRMTDAVGNEHGSVVAVANGDLRTFDAFNDNYKDKSVTELIARRKIYGSLPHPVYWIPKELAKWKAPLSEKLSEADLEKLAMETTRKIPDLAKLWAWQAKTGREVYLGGGLARGVLRWLHFQLDRMPVEEVRNLPVPTTDDLLIQANSDKDIYASEETLKLLRADHPEFEKWDISNLKTFEESAQGGGVTLDKTLLSPIKIKDDLGGLKDYHGGRVRFVDIPDEQAAETYWFKEKGNSKTAMALRFLRVSLDMPELTPDPESVKTIQRIAAHETPKLGTRHRWWLDKGIAKLTVATRYDAFEAVKLLREYGLLEPLAAHGLKLPSMDSADTIKERLGISAWTPGEEQALGKLLTLEFGKTHASSDPGLIRGGLLAAKTAEEYLERMPAVDNHVGEPTKMKLNAAYQATIDHLVSLEPSPKQLEAWFNKVYGYDLDTELLEKVLTRAKTAEEFSQKMRDVNGLPASAIPKFEALYQKLVPQFLALKPTGKDLDRAYKKNEGYEFDYLSQKGALLSATTAAEYVDRMRKVIDMSLPEVRARFDQIFDETMDHLVSLRPTGKEMRVWEGKTFDTTLDAKILEKALAQVTTAKEFLDLMRDASNMNGKNGNMYRSLYEKMRPAFIAMNPTPSERSKFETKRGSQKITVAPAGPARKPSLGALGWCQLTLSRMTLGLVPRPRGY